FDAVTIVARAEPTIESTVDERPLGPESEPAQPLYARYWLHNRGPAPLGGLPATVHLDPGAATVSVVCDRTDGDLHGHLRLTVPAPIRVSPGQSARLSIRVASSAHAPIAIEAALISPWGTWELAGPRAIGTEIPAASETDLTFDITPPPWTAPGRWWALIKVT